MTLKRLSLFALFLLTSCLKEDFPKEIFSHPNWKDSYSKEGEIKRLVVASTNSFFGKTQGVSFFLAPNRISKVGGGKTLQFYIETLRKKFSNQLILLDGGALFDNEKKNIEKTIDLYSSLKYDAVLFTEKELEVENIQNFSKIPFINSNILEIKTSSPLKTEYLLPYRMIEREGIKIGIIGTSSLKSNLAKSNALKGVYFEDPVLSYLKTREKLKKQGAQIFILLTHSQTRCSTDSQVQHKKTIDKILECPESHDDLEKIVKRIPEGMVDIVVGGDASNSSGLIGETPVLQNQGHGMFINRIEIFYDKDKNEVVKEKTILHGPTKLCRQFFSQTKDCHILSNKTSPQKIEALEKDSYKLETASFLGEKFKGNSQTN